MWQKVVPTIVLLGVLLSVPSYGQEEERSGPVITYDLGASTGSFNDRTYIEGQLGLNWFLKDWLIWRNAGFYRAWSGAEDYYGLDTSMRLRGQIGGGPLSLQVFGGPGLRFPSQGPVAPLAEAGIVLGLGGFSIGGGARVILNDWVAEDGLNDTMFFIILSGGGVL